MSTAIVLVLHGDADAKYATDLAAALAPVPTIPVPMAQGRALRLGPGAACLLIWSEAVAAQFDARSIAEMAQHSLVVACTPGSRVPDALRVHAQAVVAIQGAPAADAALLRSAFGGKQPPADAALKVRTGEAMPPPVEANGRSNSMFMRSALSLTATIAIAGAVTPMIVDRAQATSRTQASIGAAPDDADVDAAELEASDVPVVATAMPAAPAVETFAAPIVEAAPAPAPMIRQASFEPEAEPFRAYVGDTMALLVTEAPQHLDVVLPLGAMGIDASPRKVRHIQTTEWVAPPSGKNNTP
jgi:hypothetical protein